MGADYKSYTTKMEQKWIKTMTYGQLRNYVLLRGDPYDCKTFAFRLLKTKRDKAIAKGHA